MSEVAMAAFRHRVTSRSSARWCLIWHFIPRLWPAARLTFNHSLFLNPGAPKNFKDLGMTATREGLLIDGPTRAVM